MLSQANQNQVFQRVVTNNSPFLFTYEVDGFHQKLYTIV